MKHIGLIGLSVATATLIMTGCGGSSSHGPSAPAELKSAADMSISQARKAANLVYEGGIDVDSAAPKIAAKLNAVKTMADSMNKGTYSETFSCDISGSYTVSASWEYVDGEKHAWTEKCVINNCKTDGEAIDNDYFSYYCIPEETFYLTTNSDPTDTATLNGSTSVSFESVYNSDGNVSHTEVTSKANDFTASVENNETNASLKFSANYTSKWRESGDGDGYFGYYSAEKPAYSYLDSFSGHMKYVTTDSSGTHTEGYKVDGNMKTTKDGLQDDSEWTEVTNGFMAFYHILGTENNATLVEGFYADDFKVKGTENGNEETSTLSGKVGAVCLGGSVNITTNETIHSNIVDYDNNESDGTLPYAGMVTIKGTTSATVTFDHNESNYTNATVSYGEDNETYWSWESLIEPCISPMF